MLVSTVLQSYTCADIYIYIYNMYFYIDANIPVSYTFCYASNSVEAIVDVNQRKGGNKKKKKLKKVLHFELQLICASYSIPFSVDDLSTSLQEKEFSDVKPADELIEHPAFQFLQD